MTSTELNTLVQRIAHKATELAAQQQQFLADLIAIRSYTGEEGPAVPRTLQELRAIGCDDVWTDTAGNTLGRIGNGRRVILYDAHLDTNEVADPQEWPHPPLEPVIENGAMWGLGASDCKGGVAAIVYGAAILKALQISGDFTLLVMGATLEEDAEGFALRSLVERDGVRPDVVLLAEATDLTLRRGQRGRCEVRVRTTGKAVHASTPHLGESALLKMMPVIAALEAMNSRPAHPPDLRPGHPGGFADRGTPHAQLGAELVRNHRGPADDAGGEHGLRVGKHPRRGGAARRHRHDPRAAGAHPHRRTLGRAELLSRLAAG